MKISVLPLVLLLPYLVSAQNRPSKEQSALPYVKMAVNAASAVQHQSLEGYIALFIDDKSWAALSKDSDLGPFLKLKRPKEKSRMVCLLALSASGPSLRIAVYFDGLSVTDLAAFTPGPGAKISADLLKPVPKSDLHGNDAASGLVFTPGDATSDDGAPIPAYTITKPEEQI